MKKPGVLLTSILMFLLLMMSSSAFAEIFADNYYTLQEVPFTWVGTYANRTIANKVYTYGDESLTTKILWSRYTFYGRTDYFASADTNGNVWLFSGTKSAHSFNLAQSGARVISAWNNDLSSYYYGGVFMEENYNQSIIVEWVTETYTDEGYGRLNNFEVVIFKDGRIRIDYKTFNPSTNKDFGSGISMGDGTAYLSITEKFGNVTTLAGRSFLYTPIPQGTSSPPAANLTATNTVQTFTIQNQGTGELNVNSLSLSGADAANFSITSSTCTGSALAGTETCTVQVAYNPTTAAPAIAPTGATLKAVSLSTESTSSGTSNTKVATLNIATNDPANPVLAVPMTAYTGILTINKAGFGSGVVTSNSGGINCGTTCTGTGTSLTLTATPDPGSIFTGWSGGGCAGTGTCTIVMSSDATVTAMFDTILPWVTVNPVSNPSKVSSQTLSGAMKAGSTVSLSATTAASIGAVVYPTATTWQCDVSNLAVGSNMFTVTATNQSGNKQANISVTYAPFVAMTLSTSSIVADYQGTLGITVSSINPAGSEVLIEQLVDANRNGVVDAGDYVIRSFKVSDGITAANPNMQGDMDGAVNGTVTTSLNYFLTSDLYHAPGHYIFKVTKGTETATAPFVVDPVSQLQTVSGTISDGINPIPGATVRLLDKWQRTVAWTSADGSGAYVLNIKQPGDYYLTPINYGYVAPAIPVTIAASQSLVNQTLTLTPGTYHITGKVIDAVSSTGIGGVWVQAKGTNTTGFVITSTDGSYDLLLPAGQYAINTLADTTVPGTFAKGYPSFNNHPLNVTVNGNVAGMDIALTNGDIHVSGRVLDPPGNPVQGLPVAGRIRGAIDVREPVNFSISDAAGNYALDLFSGTNWDIFLDNSTAQSLGYLGSVSHGLSTAVGPLTGHDLTVHPITAWIQGTIKDSTNKLLSGIEVQLHNADSSITTSVFTAQDGTYRLSAFAGTWYVDALTSDKGLPVVPEQTLVLADAQTATNNFTVDVTAPTVTITSPTAGITNNPKPTLAYTVSDGTVVVKVDGVIVSKLSGDTLDLLANGQHTVRVESTDTSGNLGYAEVTFTVNFTPPAISTSSLTDGYLTSAYSQTLMATGGKTPYTWSITSTTKLPAGLILDASSGVISGTPTATVTNSSITFQAADANGKTASKVLSITIAAPVVTQLNAWTNLYSAVPNNTRATNLAAGSFTVGTGTNRLLLVAVVMEIGTAANPAISASYGGTPLTLIKATANTQREIVWVGYLKESPIGSGSKTLTVTYSGATGNVSALHVKWASFSGVNQTAPIASSGGVNTNTTSATFGSAINYVTNGMTTVVAGNGGTPATGTLSATPAFTAGTATTTNAQTSRTFTTAKHTAAGNYASTTPVTWSGTSSAWSGLVVVSLQP